MKKIEERRKFIRLGIPVELKYIIEGETQIKHVTTKDLSCEGLRFISDVDIGEGRILELNLSIPKATNPIHIKGKAAWTKKLSTEDDSQHEVGVEFMKIEEDNKNTFLRYLCDLIYGQTKMMERSQK